MLDRTVAALDPVQLYRKRAFDRENQRQSRLRKKGKLEDLEAEVKDLKERLRVAEETAEQLRKQNASLQEAVRCALSTLQNAVHEGDPEPSPETTSLASNNAVQDGTPMVSNQDLYSITPVTTLPDAEGQSQHSSPTSIYPFQVDLENVEVAQQMEGFSFSLPLDSWFEMPNALHEEATDPGYAPANAFSLTLLDCTNPVLGSVPDESIQLVDKDPAVETQSLPTWRRLPIHTPPDSKIEAVMLGLTKSCGQHVQNSSHIEELSEPTFPSVASLLNPETKNAKKPVSSAIGNHGKMTMKCPRLAERVALMYLMCNYVRWLVLPSKQTYESMPQFLRPTEAQLSIPHPIWIDLVPWPGARDVLINEMDWSQFELFRSVTGATHSVNWWYREEDIFLSVAGNELRLSPLFEKHIRDIKNYSWSSNVTEVFPFLEPFVTKERSTW
ncbi:uncharacterized protein PV09_07927 [Verruconis gallopava]|uniref:BZIP domain-containing protein n=1 Tax=Verruconis gallopava TaxID=253628 RepID=A0A0D2A1K5_9PEZI|nr:uncharacterized protein PV09_07927 [Verruconis gallopava]KIW00573.1 hypothetical protein PV09_07927 [Verruconis gallopava]